MIKLETDYTDRCGNCHSYMNPKDKYCCRCGTIRGKGKFLPYENQICVLYGPPTKMKYKCEACQNIWIDCVSLGDSKYCPLCGKKQIKLLEWKSLPMFSFYIGTEEPYDLGKEPILFEEKQIIKLLELREKREKDFIGFDKIVSSMRMAGIIIPDEVSHENFPLEQRKKENKCFWLKPY